MLNIELSKQNRTLQTQATQDTIRNGITLDMIDDEEEDDERGVGV